MAFYGSHVKSANSSDKNTNISESNNQSYVRLLLFKESGFKGRSLIFDSNVIENLPNSNQQSTSSDNFWKLSEMVFGSLSLRCHDTYFRIHRLSSPNRIMFTQVFQFPGSKKIFSTSDTCATSSSSHSLGLGSVRTKSDLLLFQDSCNLPDSSTNTMDSGYAEKSFSSFTISSRSSFNSDASLNRNHSGIPKTETGSFLSDLDVYGNDSTDSFSSKSSPALGIVIILATDVDAEEYPGYYLKHTSFIESVALRIRQSIEFSCKKHGSLTSTMVQIYHESTQWLTRMFPKLKKSSGNVQCGTSNRYFEEHDDSLKLKIASLMFKIKRPKFSLSNNVLHILKKERKGCDDEFDDFCELLKHLDSKEKKFFASSVITAALTYHLGWVTTCFPCPFGEENEPQPTTKPYNSLWKQLAELYGANGCPIKSAQTVISGSNQDEVAKILHFIRCFIRYSSVIQNFLERTDVDKDNKTADTICKNYDAYGNYFHETEVAEPTFHKVRPTLSKSKAWSANLSQLSKEEGFEESSSAQEERVTFLLGENEELVNIKPKKASGFTTTTSPNIDETITSTTTKFDPFVQHSSSLLDDLQESAEQRRVFDHLVASNNERSKCNYTKKSSESDVGTKFSFTSPMMHFPIHNPNLSYCDENKHIPYLNKKPKAFHKMTKMKFFSFPLPKSKVNSEFETPYASTLQSGDVVGKYIPDMVVQGTTRPQKEWLSTLKRDLYLARQTYFFGGYVDESVAIVGNTDTWDVEIISSRVSINQKATGMKLDTSPLVSNMLEVLLHMRELEFCKKFSTTHIEQRLMEICIRSYAFSQFLLHTNMCTMDLLTTTLHLEVNDIPLLMSVASIIAPQVTKKYGLSYQ